MLWFQTQRKAVKEKDTDTELITTEVLTDDNIKKTKKASQKDDGPKPTDSILSERWVGSVNLGV